MNSKQTESDGQQKKTMPEDWSSVGGKTKSGKPTNGDVAAEFQKVLAEGAIDGISPNRNAASENAHSIATASAIEPEDGANATASL